MCRQRRPLPSSLLRHRLAASGLHRLFDKTPLTISFSRAISAGGFLSLALSGLKPSQVFRLIGLKARAFISISVLPIAMMFRLIGLKARTLCSRLWKALREAPKDTQPSAGQRAEGRPLQTREAPEDTQPAAGQQAEGRPLQTREATKDTQLASGALRLKVLSGVSPHWPQGPAHFALGYGKRLVRRPKTPNLQRVSEQRAGYFKLVRCPKTPNRRWLPLVLTPDSCPLMEAGISFATKTAGRSLWDSCLLMEADIGFVETHALVFHVLKWQPVCFLVEYNG